MSASTPGGRPFTPDALRDQVALGELALWGDEPGTALLAYTRRVTVGWRTRTDLWAVGWNGGAERRLTESPGTDTRPRFRPDGAVLAFLRGSQQEAAQVWQLALGDGTPRPLTGFPGGVVDFDWSPDGRRLVVLAEEESSDDEVPAPDDAEGDGPTSRVIRRTDWRADGEGLRLRPRHLHLVDPAGGTARRLTSGPWSAARPRYGADGLVYFLAEPGSTAHPARPPRPQVHRLDPHDPAAPHPVTGLPGGVERFHPPGADGVLTVYGHPHGAPRDGDPPRLRLLHPDGRSTAPEAHEGWWTGRPGGTSDLFDWSADPDDSPAATVLTRDGEARPVDPRDGTPLARTGERVVCAALASAGVGTAAVMTVGTGAHAPEVYALEPSGPRRLTRSGSAWLEGYALPRVEAAEFDGPAGPVGGWLVRPCGTDASTPPPAVLVLHGGPTEQWEAVPPLEAVLLAARGHLVVLPNLRGSTDRGAAWAAGLRGRWGEADAADVEAVRAEVVRRGLADPARIGVSGLSYGGFLVNWLIGTTDRYAAAVSENGVTNQVSAWANCDVGPDYAESAALGDPLTPEGVAALWRTSPLRHVAAVRTPLLLLQAEDDLRCPAADGEQLFQALLRLGRDVAYVTYPGESHLMTGLGRTDRRVDRHRRVLAHFARHLAPRPAPG